MMSQAKAATTAFLQFFFFITHSFAFLQLNHPAHFFKTRLNSVTNCLFLLTIFKLFAQELPLTVSCQQEVGWRRITSHSCLCHWWPGAGPHDALCIHQRCWVSAILRTIKITKLTATLLQRGRRRECCIRFLKYTRLKGLSFKFHGHFQDITSQTMGHHPQKFLFKHVGFKSCWDGLVKLMWLFWTQTGCLLKKNIKTKQGHCTNKCS